MNFKKRVNGSWTDIPHYIHNTSTDTITTLPAVLYPTGATATVGLKGQAVQSGTPTPDSPIMPNGTGERTGNLWNAIKYNYTSLSDSSVWVYSTSLTGSVYRIPCMPNTKYTLYLAENVNISIWRICEVSTDVAPNASSTSVPTTGTYATAVPASKSATFTTSATAKYILFQTNEAAYDSVLRAIMLIEGNTKIPYEPYGYKIPISSANTTTPVYLGEVETTRKIRKLVFDGTEAWERVSGNAPYRLLLSNLATTTDRDAIFFTCSHFLALSNNASWSQYDSCVSVSFSGGISVKGLQFRYTSVSSLEDFKSYLAAQYAAGTPVTAWYLLASETTGVVNEPLMKIGTYADTLSSISIPVTAGGDTISVDTTVQPSEVTVNYKGWHPVADVHERENGAWT